MGYIRNGKFHSGNPPMQDMVPQPTSVWKNSDHDRQRADHKHELVQPYNRDGTVNDEFVTAYPAESKEVYKFLPSDEELAKGQRNG